MHTIGFLDLKNYTEASRLFDRSYKDYIREPFKTWYEVVLGKFGAQNFMTGAGGFLQSVINGYGGIRLHFNNLNITNFALPPKTTKLTIKGFSFLNNRFTLDISGDSAEISFHTINSQSPIELLVDGNVMQVAANSKCEYGCLNTKDLKVLKIGLLVSRFKINRF